MERQNQTGCIPGVVLLLAFLACVCTGNAFADADSKYPDSQPTKRVEKYIYKRTPQAELAIHIHFPEDWTADDKRPAIVFFFGGGWHTGSVEQFVPQAEYLAGRGMVAARADYRVLDRHGTKADKCVEDGKSAVRWLRANAAKLGVDPNRIAASGGSAGGHVAACTCTTKRLEAEGEDLSVSSKPNLLVLFWPVLRIFGRDPRWDSREMGIKISPYHNLTQNVPPTLIFCGTKDGNILDGIDFVKKSEKLGITVELYMAKGQGHAFAAPWGKESIYWRQATNYLMDKFLARYGYTQGEPPIKFPDGQAAMENMSEMSADDIAAIRKKFALFFYIFAPIALVIVPVSFGIPLGLSLRRVTGQRKCFFRYFALLIAIYLFECAGVAAGKRLACGSWPYSFPLRLAFAGGLACVWGVVLGRWLRGRSMARKVLRTSLFVSLYASLPTVCVCVLWPVVLLMHGISIIDVGRGTGFGLYGLPWPLNTVLGYFAALALSVVLLKTAIITSEVGLLIRLGRTSSLSYASTGSKNRWKQ
jgi:acetyl esterase/lipase